MITYNPMNEQWEDESTDLKWDMSPEDDSSDLSREFDTWMEFIKWIIKDEG